MAESSLPAIIARNLSKSFGTLKAVDELSLTIFQGEVFGLLGPNGAGKTTTINMLCGLLKPDSGNVTIGNASDGRINRKRVGVCPQEIILWQRLTCYEQLVYLAGMYGVGHKTASGRALELLADMGLSEKKDTLAKALSGGMQRRMNIIMALVHDPDIVVLDEPEAGLDPQSRVLVREYIRKLAGIKTVIFTTHNMDEAERICHRIAIMDCGRILIHGTPENLKQSVGEGGLIEAELPGLTDGQWNSLNNEMLKLGANPVRSGNYISLRAKDPVQVLPSFITIIRDCISVQPEIRIRENSLEDVFISLTGRRLRE